MDNNNNIFNNSNNSSQNMAPVNQQIYTGLPSVSFSNSIYSIPKKEDHKYLTSMKQNYWFFLIASIIYGVIFSFSISLNPRGITSPLFAIASFIYIILCTKKSSATIKTKPTILLSIAIALIGINLCYTTDVGIISWDYIFIFALSLILAIQNFFDISKWGLGKYIEALLCSTFGAIPHLFSIITDGKEYVVSKKDSSKKNTTIIYISIGIVATIPLLFIVISLLASADKFFGEFVENVIIKPLSISSFERFSAITLFMIGLVGSYTLMHWLCTHNFYEECTEHKKNPALIAITITSVLNFVYIIFSGFQIFYLFLGDMTLPADYTFAEYAREGFFQLVAVCIINMLLVLIFINVFEKSKALKVMLTITSGCTYIMIASSLMRMIMYINMYQLTYTRLFVLWALVVIFFGMCGTVIYIHNNNFPILKYFTAVVICLYCIFAYSRPAYIIAQNNLDAKFFEASADPTTKYQNIDFKYFKQHYSEDALPALANAMAREDNEYFTKQLAAATEYGYAVELSFEYYSMDSTIKMVKENHSYISRLDSFRNYNFAEAKAYKASRLALQYKVKHLKHTS